MMVYTDCIMNETQAELLLLKITTSKGMEEWGSIVLWILSSIIFLLYLDYFYLFFFNCLWLNTQQWEKDFLKKQTNKKNPQNKKREHFKEHSILNYCPKLILGIKEKVIQVIFFFNVPWVTVMKVYVEDTFKSQITSSIVLGFPTRSEARVLKAKYENISKLVGSGVLIAENVKYFQETVKTIYFSLIIFVVFLFIYLFFYFYQFYFQGGWG